jgi:hypothetical protein
MAQALLIAWSQNLSAKPAPTEFLKMWKELGDCSVHSALMRSLFQALIFYPATASFSDLELVRIHLC